MEVFESLDKPLYWVAAVLAWLVARKDTGHRWIAAYITWMIWEDSVRLGLKALLSAGLLTAAIREPLDHLIVTSWQFLFVACCVHYFVGRRVHAVFAVWAAVWLVQVFHPAWTDDQIASFVYAVWVTTLVFNWAVIISGVLRRPDLSPRLAHLMVILYAATDVVFCVVPLRRGVMENWPVLSVANTLLMVALCVVQFGWLARRTRHRDRVIPNTVSGAPDRP